MRAATTLLAILAATGLAAAEPTKAEKLFAEGRDLLVNQDKPKAACKKFEAAIALDSTAPGVMLNLGLCYEKLERFATSLYWFRKALSSASESELPEYEEAAKQHMIDLASKVAIGKIDPAGLPDDVEVSIGNRPVPRAELARVELDLGPNRIVARAPGKQQFETVHQVSSRDGGTIAIVMKDEVAFERIDAGAGRRKLAYVVGGTSLALGVTCLALNLSWKSEQESTSSPKRYDQLDSRMRTWGTGLFAASIASGVASVVIYVTAPGITKRETRVAPYADADGAGVVLGGSF